MSNKEFDYDKKKLWETEPGTIIKINRDKLIEILGLESFNLSKDYYRFLLIYRNYDDIVSYNLDNKKFEYLPTGLLEGEDFDIYNLPYYIDLKSNEKIKYLIDILSIKLLEEVSEDNLDNCEKYIKQIEILKKLDNILNSNEC